MKGFYLHLLINQYMAAKGIKKVDYLSENFREEFKEWLKGNQKAGNTYFNFIESFEAYPSLNPICTAEVGKGKYDSVALSQGIGLITPFREEIAKSQIILPTEFRVYDCTPFAVKEEKGHSHFVKLTDSGIERYMTQNPYTIESIKRWEQLHNSGTSNITVGVYGNIHDKDFESKMELMQNLRERIMTDEVIEDYATDRDNYFYALSSTRKELKPKTRILTR